MPYEEAMKTIWRRAGRMIVEISGTMIFFVNLRQPKYSRDMKGTLIGLVTAFLAVILLAVTCPDKQEHKEAIKAMVGEAVDESVSAEDNADAGGLIDAAGTFILSPLVDVFTDSKLKVDNYVVVSVGRITIDGETHTVSLGVLNHVFAFGKDEVRKTLQGA